MNETVVVDVAPVAPPRVNRKHQKSLSVDQKKSHSEPSSPLLPRARPAPPHRPKLTRRTSSSERDYQQSSQLHFHAKLDKKPSAPIRPPPPKIAIISKKLTDGRRTPPRIPPAPTSIPPRPRTSRAVVSTEQSNAKKSKLRVSEQHFNTNPRPPKKKSVERRTSQPETTVTPVSNTNKLELKPETIYRNVAPRLPPYRRKPHEPTAPSQNVPARRKSNEPSPTQSLPAKTIQTHNKSTDYSKSLSYSPIQKNKNGHQLSKSTGIISTLNKSRSQTKPQRPPHPTPRGKVIPYAVYTEITDKEKQQSSDAEYSYVRMTSFVKPATSRPIEGLNLEVPDGQDMELYGERECSVCVKASEVVCTYFNMHGVWRGGR